MWKEDRKHGPGSLAFENKMSYNGDWENGQMKDGDLTFNDFNGKYEGCFDK